MMPGARASALRANGFEEAGHRQSDRRLGAKEGRPETHLELESMCTVGLGECRRARAPAARARAGWLINFTRTPRAQLGGPAASEPSPKAPRPTIMPSPPARRPAGLQATRRSDFGPLGPGPRGSVQEPPAATRITNP
jgi:hypothetical protein